MNKFLVLGFIFDIYTTTLWETRIKHTVPASNQVELNGDSMLDLHRNRAFHQGNTLALSTMVQDSV